ncbi:hypothetical protein UCRPA7_8913 [Phaeoacremonium minimum UCRPA7]|uniref:Ubiquitin 3 binding protein But2 C-terminal domain-containing protein n=1 Tax=Phaeoacremonium minimum (strain UCR-PA7) TaxID=1286976 RepID=R8B8G7_PHAM7|nr:hypothetical protein UCRPA7_8913 [Phaeoacremonium minimum UCRPA7]EON95599.1 hypothetical protein UCRPA7_8913 [Phaeoacremonium minimum UCRPA7]
MQFTTIVLSVLSAAAAVSAAPAQQQKRACEVKYPNALGFPINFHISKDATSNVPNDISFTIPANARGPCSLVYQFPVGTPITTTGNPALNIKALDGPATGSIVGTATFVADGQLHTINSFACRTTMGFELSIAGEAGSVNFSEVQGTGLWMTYNC